MRSGVHLNIIVAIIEQRNPWSSNVEARGSCQERGGRSTESKKALDRHD